MVNAIQNPIAMPPQEVVVDRAVRRKVLRKIAPLATGAQDIHHGVGDRTHVGPTLATTGLGWRNQWCNIGPLVIREVARVPQMITIVFRPVLKRPHRRPSPNHVTSFESNRFTRFKKFQNGHLARRSMRLPYQTRSIGWSTASSADGSPFKKRTERVSTSR